MYVVTLSSGISTPFTVAATPPVIPLLLPQPASAKTHAAAAVTQMGASFSFMPNMGVVLRLD
jgi:hypothetical protein